MSGKYLNGSASSRGSLLSVAEAHARAIDGVAPLETEHVPLAAAAGRVLAEPLAALRTQPPWPVSAMDGYAVRGEDVEKSNTLRVVGQAVAGRRFDGPVDAGETVRIFTGAPLPEDTDTIVIQENAETAGDMVSVPATDQGRFVRPAGLDFAEGEELLESDQILTPARISLAAAMGHAALPVRRKPVCAILSTGDELCLPGEDLSEDQIVASNNFGVAALLNDAGAIAVDLGVAPDDPDIIAAKLRGAFDGGADVIITTGGASVGDHDHMQDVTGALGIDLGFWKIAMRPGKPLMMGRIEAQRFVGLPGNPVSAFVCTRIFVVPVIRAMLGLEPADRPRSAILGVPLPANDERQDYLRARLTDGDDGHPIATPFGKQDSSMVKRLAQADVLVIRKPNAPTASEGDRCEYIPISPSRQLA